jgi:Leucine-rich repeat (LRR) protein
MTGIKHFTALTYLDCNDNKLPELDVSGMTTLVTLLCYHNNLTALDVSGLVNLKILRCFNNELNELDVTDLTALTTLLCDYNNLTELIVSQSTGLTQLSCSNNCLTELDVSTLLNLLGLKCDNNNLSKLDVSACEKLAALSCSSNYLTELNISGLKSLAGLHCYNNYLTELSVDASILAQLYCYTNYLTYVDLSKCTAVNDFKGENQRVTVVLTKDESTYTSAPITLNELTGNSVPDLSYADGVLTDSSLPDNARHLDAQGFSTNTGKSGKVITGTLLLRYDTDANGIPDDEAAYESEGDTTINADNFPDARFREFLMAQTYGADGVLTSEEIAGISALDVTCIGAAGLKGIEYFTALQSLICEGNKLTALDVSKLTNLQTLNCKNNSLIDLEVSGLDKLTSLLCEVNKLPELNLTGLSALKELNCKKNNLTELDVSNSTALEKLHCTSNDYTKLDVSNLENLTELTCYQTNLTELILGNLSNLSTLDCDDTLLTELDLSGLTGLISLYCYDTFLTKLDVSNSPKLANLGFSKTYFTSVQLHDSVTTFGSYGSERQRVYVTLTNVDGIYTSEPITLTELTGDLVPGLTYANGVLTDESLPDGERHVAAQGFSTDVVADKKITGILFLRYDTDGNGVPDDEELDNPKKDDEKPTPSAPSGGGGGGGGGGAEPSPSPSASPAPETGVDSELTNPYIDVHESDWFYSDVLTVTFAGLMKGKDTTYTYCPSDNLTRAEWVMILARLEKSPAANAVSDPWYQAVWDWGIAEGITDGTNPTFPITREQLVTILWRLNDSPASNADALNAFADASSVSDWARDAVAWAVERRILQGDANGLRPRDNVKRSEVAAILRRYTAG